VGFFIRFGHVVVVVNLFNNIKIEILLCLMLIRIRRESTHREDSCSCCGRSCSSWILDCLFDVSEISAQEKKSWEVLRLNWVVYTS